VDEGAYRGSGSVALTVDVEVASITRSPECKGGDVGDPQGGDVGDPQGGDDTSALDK